MKSPKEKSVDQKLLELTKELMELISYKDDLPLRIARDLVEDEEVQCIQDYRTNHLH